MIESDDRPVSPTYMGFQRWTKLSIDDDPLIRPPRRHMLSHVTGGLTELYSIITEDKKRKEEKHSKEKDCKVEENEKPNNVDSVEPLKNELEERNGHLNELENDEKEKNKAKKKDDEGGGKKILDGELDDDEEETSPYTDEEGEFAPDKTIPLLASRYRYVDVLARGQSALIIKALDTFAKDKPVAIKVLHRIYKPIGSQEADILLELHRADPWLHVPFARLQNQFIYGPHYCLVFDFLSPTPLYNHYDQRNIRGPTSLPHVRNLCVKLLTVLGFLHKQNVIHADLKPENILLVEEGDTSSVMVIDFGNALRNTEEELSLYYSDFELQTLLYRAPEVIFGLKFSLEIDMWSLGCLLAECYTGEPLFMGKTKEDILSKMTKLLGPFPKEFEEGECAEMFSEFIGKPLTRFERVENLRKKFNSCHDINFLHLLERLLTYQPDKRISPFEAACHPFIAKVNPFLYLSASQELKRYPTVLLDMTTYPYLPGLPNDNSLDKTSLDGRKRLQRYSQSLTTKTSKTSGEAKKDDDESVSVKNMINEDKENIPDSSNEDVQPLTSTSSKSESPQPSQNVVVPQTSSTMPPSPVQATSTSSSSPIPCTQPVINASDSVKSPQSDSSQSSTQAKSVEKKNKDESVIPLKSPGQSQDQSGNFSRTDVKQTLKSMGLRCEDFTISVYSREQAHAILRKQGVEVTNHLPTSTKPQVPQQQQQPQVPQQQQQQTPVPQQQQPQVPQQQQPQVPQQQQQPQVPPPPPQQQQQPQPQQQPPQPQQQASPPQPSVPPIPSPSPSPSISIPSPSVSKPTKRPTKSASTPSVRPSVSVLRSESSRPPPSQPPPKSQTTGKVDDDDDDDCVILDPPEGPKPPPPPPRRYPQQFQLMGTTVQVNRGSKRQMRSMPHAPLAKRQFSRSPRPYYYNESYNYEETQEASVQDTLKRLKNYNISITCRRNSSQRHPRVHTMDSDSSDLDHDGSHLDSEDEEDMAKYLECEIDEEKDISMEAEETLELDSSGSVNDLSSDNVESAIKNKESNDKVPDKSGTEKTDEENLNKTIEVEEEKTEEMEELNSEKNTENVKESEVYEDIVDKETPNSQSSAVDTNLLEEKAVPQDEEEPASTAEAEKMLEESDAAEEKVCDSVSNDQALTDDGRLSRSEIMDENIQENSELVNDQDLKTSDNETLENAASILNTDNAKSPNSLECEKPEEKITEDNPEAQATNIENNSITKDVCDNIDDDINEELEKQLLGAGNLEDDEYGEDDMEGECLDNYDLENEL